MTAEELFGHPTRRGRIVFIDPLANHVYNVRDGRRVADEIIGKLVVAEDNSHLVHIGRRRHTLCEDPRLIEGRIPTVGQQAKDAKGVYLIDDSAPEIPPHH